MNNITIIAAVSVNGVIGIGDNIPWHIPNDLKHYKEQTTDNVLIVGSKTYDLLPKVAKKNREFKILTSRPEEYLEYNVEAFTTANDLMKSLDNVMNKKIFVIGGTTIYNLFIDYCTKAIITWVNKEIKDGDKTFPIHRLIRDFKIVDDSGWLEDDKGNIYKFTTYNKSL